MSAKRSQIVSFWRPFLFAMGVLALLSFGGCAHASPSGGSQIHSFEECVAAGNIVRRTLPATCMSADGQVFTEPRAADRAILRKIEPSPDKAALPDLGLEGRVQGESSQKSGFGKMCKDLCGDGECQEIVCMAQGCPCPETPQNCPKDCTSR